MWARSRTELLLHLVGQTPGLHLPRAGGGRHGPDAVLWSGLRGAHRAASAGQIRPTIWSIWRM